MQRKTFNACLSGLGRRVSVLRTAFDSAEADPRRILAATLVALATCSCCDEKRLPTITQDLYSSEASVRNSAALQLARCGDRARPAVPRLAALLYDSNVGVQSSASYALRKIDTPDARKAIDDAMTAKERRRKLR